MAEHFENSLRCVCAQCTPWSALYEISNVSLCCCQPNVCPQWHRVSNSDSPCNFLFLVLRCCCFKTFKTDLFDILLSFIRMWVQFELLFFPWFFAHIQNKMHQKCKRPSSKNKVIRIYVNSANGNSQFVLRKQNNGQRKNERNECLLGALEKW